jgi:hypothetical protein
MTVQIDLFGQPLATEPEILRSARFVDDGRIELHRRFGDGRTACVIGHNPSEAGGDRDDPTSRWWNRWFPRFGFGAYTAVNLYPWICPAPAECYNRLAALDAGCDFGARDLLHFVNLPAVVQVAKQADQVFVCWGAIARDQEWIDHVVEAIQSGEPPYPDLWCWGMNADGSPKHPMARGKHRIDPAQPPILWKAAA